MIHADGSAYEYHDQTLFEDGQDNHFSKLKPCRSEYIGIASFLIALALWNAKYHTPIHVHTCITHMHGEPVPFEPPKSTGKLGGRLSWLQKKRLQGISPKLFLMFYFLLTLLLPYFSH